MGWGNCGVDSIGRPIGYVHPATCDHDGCEAVIDRGLSYACGGMHGDGTCSCEKYFCSKHLGLPSWEGMYDVLELDDIDMSDVVHEYLTETEDSAHICTECQSAFAEFANDNPDWWLDEVKQIVDRLRKERARAQTKYEERGKPVNGN